MTETAGTSTSERSDSMARAWATRKAHAAIQTAWFQKPVCLCGCGEKLVRHRNQEKQRLFKPGHDARLKSIAAGVLAGEIGRDAIPEVARALKKRIGFLRTRPELEKAF